MVWCPGRAIYYGLFQVKRALARPYRSRAKVVSVGNLVLGGSGKTPLVIFLARKLKEMGFRVAVASRGYGSRGKGTRLATPESDPREVGDEPVLIAAEAGVPVFVDPRRPRAVMAAEEVADVVILDDGHQNFSVEKDFSIVVIYWKHLRGGVKLLPLGPWREPLSALKRADAVVINLKADPVQWEGQQPAMRYEPERLDGQRVFGFSGLGDNSSFLEALRASGAKVVGFKGFPDHHFYAPQEIERILKKAKKLGAFPITSTKDWIRLPPELRGEVRPLRFEIRVEPDLSYECVKHLFGSG